MTTPTFIGSGWAFPLQTSAAGGLALASGATRIEQSIWLILATARGERPMRPEFGCNLYDYVFAPADATTAGLIARDVHQALRRWEPRIEVRSVEVEPDPDDPAVLTISIAYTIRSTNDPRNLVFPFYVNPGEPPAGA